MEQRQRLYIKFARQANLRFLSQLDMMRLWERAFRRAALPLRYSQGYHPHPRISLALPLTVGMIASAEWLEVELHTPVPLAEVCERLAGQLPSGIVLRWVGEAPWKACALAAQLQGAEYEIELQRPPSREGVEKKVQQFMEADTWPVEEWRKGKRRTRDLRKAVVELALGMWTEERGCLNMVLYHRPDVSARPDRILQALGLGDRAHFYRRRLHFQEAPLVQGLGMWCSDE